MRCFRNADRALFGLLIGAAVVGSVGPGEAAETIGTYELTFTRYWTEASHPFEFPANRHFSGLIGSSHQPGESFWAPGELASRGVEDVAERGNKTNLRGEIDATIEAGLSGSRIDFFGISSSRVVRTEQFQVREAFDHVSIISMVAPSPDWFIGVRDVDLLGPDGWTDELQFDLFSYDAGTDSGTTFFSRNSDTSPADPIAVLTDSPLDGTPPIAGFGFRLLSVEAAPLIGDYNDDGTVTAADYTTWRDQLGEAIALPNEDPLASPAEVTMADYHAWRAAFGAATDAVAAVPEPSAGVLAIAVALAGRGRRRRHSELVG